MALFLMHHSRVPVTAEPNSCPVHFHCEHLLHHDLNFHPSSSVFVSWKRTVTKKLPKSPHLSQNVTLVR
ncbi:hypothetical protein LDENG_00248380 [Lucifuga dentata]|nr:hypothetical protein LDENG_00248380 [Lucifuga dentata]